MAERRRFILRKLHSLSGVVPLGVFVVLHLTTQAQALWGQARYDEAVGDLQKVPYLAIVEVALVLLPLAFHALYGIVLSFESRPNVGTYPYSRNWMYLAQRVSGIAAFAFVVWHVPPYWLDKWRGELAPADFYPALCADLSSAHGGVPITALAYLLGIAATIFHFANGLWGFGVSWGITVSRRAQRFSATVFGIVGVLLFLLGGNTAIYFATGSRFAVFGIPEGSHAAVVKTCSETSPPHGVVVQ